jgi:hypothetical protein
MARLGGLAQLVEQRTLNPFVDSSILSSPTSIQAAHSDVSRFHFENKNHLIGHGLIALMGRNFR